MRHWRAGDNAAAAEAQETLTAARLALQAFPAIPTLKALTADRTGDPAWTNMLPPFWPLSEDKVAEIKAAMRPYGLAGTAAEAAE
jgi:4-hydroxy-tetrahydrodipicolinate synthase